MNKAVIILGGAIDTTGSIDERTKLRVKEGIRISIEQDIPFIVMSGAYGYWADWNNNVPEKTEAAGMKEYAVSLGVSPEKIIMEDSSKDTLANAFFSRMNIIDKKGWRNFVVVTSEYHINRSAYMFEQVFGPEYNIQYSSVITEADPGKRKCLKKQEGHTIQVLKETIMKSVIPGDMKTISDALFLKHPGYCDDPEYTFEDMRKLFGM